MRVVMMGLRLGSRAVARDTLVFRAACRIRGWVAVPRLGRDKKWGARRLPEYYKLTIQLERVLQHQDQVPRMVRERGRPIVERGVACE